MQIKMYKCKKNSKRRRPKAIVMMMLDEVAWLFNLQGSDIDFNPGELGRPRVVLRKVYIMRCIEFARESLGK